MKNIRSLVPYLLPSIIALILALVLPFRAVLQPAPFAFGEDSPLPDKASVCPGDVLHWQLTTVVSRPAVVDYTQTLWSVGEQRTVVPDTTPKAFIWREPTTIKRTVTYTVPIEPPNVYEVRVAGKVDGAEPAMYYVPFSIRGGCP